MILFNKILFIFVFSNYLFAQNLYLDAPKDAISGSEYRFTITAIGLKVKYQSIDDIGKYPITLISSTKSITTQNGKEEFMYKKTFALTAKESFILPIFTINIDSNDYYTKLQKITIKPPAKTKSDNFELTIKSDKHSVYVGQQINYSVIFKYKDDIQIADLDFVSAEFTNFWSKTLDNNTKIYKKDGYNIQELYFLLFAQKSGQLEIKPSKINLTIANKYDDNSIFNNPDEEITIHSNALAFDIKELPNNVSLIGNFEITTEVDKNSISKGEAVNFKVQIKGIGNIDDYDDIVLKIKDTTIYSNKAKKDYFVKAGLYGGIYTKSFSILAQNDFIIPSIKFRYFDYKNNITKEINTDLYYISINNKDTNTLINKTDNNTSSLIIKHNNLKKYQESISNKKIAQKLKLNNNQKILYFSAGFLGALIFIIIIKLIKQNNRRTNTSNNTQITTQKIKNTKTPQELLNMILPNIGKNKDLDNIIYTLENLSYNQNNDNDKVKFKKMKKKIDKVIIELLQTINSKEENNEKDPFYTNDNI